MPNNPLTQQELYDYGILRILNPPDYTGASVYFPAGYFLVPPHDVDGPVLWRKFNAGYISEGLIDPERLGTEYVGDGDLYLADDQTWKPVPEGNVTVRTINSYIATEGQTNFIISVAFDFFDIYLNGARLIESEFTISVNTISLVSPAEVGDEIIIVSYKDTGMAQLPKDYDVLHDFVSPYSYVGKALADTSLSANAWTIKRIEILGDGSTIVTTATNVNWINRYTHTYT